MLIRTTATSVSSMVSLVAIGFTQGAVLCLAVLADGSFSQALAQSQARTESRSIQPGQPLGASFPTTQGDLGTTPYHDYAISLSQNQSIRVEMVSPDPSNSSTASPSRGFDTFLELRRSTEGEALRIDDDSGEGLNSRLVFTAPTEGTYLIRARPLSGVYGEQLGSYQLSVTALPSPPPPTALSGNFVRGRLGPESPEDVAVGTVRYASYWFEGVVGERVQFDLQSSGESPGLQVIDAEGTVRSANVAFGSDAVRLITVLPAAGRYQVRVHSPADQVVNYSMAVTRANPGPSQPPQTLTASAPIRGELSLRSEAEEFVGDPGQLESFYQMYRFDAVEGRPMTVLLSSEDFSPIMEAGEASVVGFIPLLTGTEMVDGITRLVIQPYESGSVLLRVRSPGLDVGRFELRVVPGIARE